MMKSQKYSGKLKKAKVFLRRVSGKSMLPSLKPGQFVLVSSSVKNVKPGNIVVFNHGGLEKIKRVEKVQKSSVIVLGDNQAHSTDSRDFGSIPNKNILGKVVFKL